MHNTTPNTSPNMSPNTTPNTQRNMVADDIRIGASAGHVDFMLFLSFFPVRLPNADVVSGEVLAVVPGNDVHSSSTMCAFTLYINGL